MSRLYTFKFHGRRRGEYVLIAGRLHRVTDVISLYDFYAREAYFWERAWLWIASGCGRRLWSHP